MIAMKTTSLLETCKLTVHYGYHIIDEVAIDTSNIITGSRRTRGARVDYTKFGPDGSDDD